VCPFESGLGHQYFQLIYEQSRDRAFCAPSLGKGTGRDPRYPFMIKAFIDYVAEQITVLQDAWLVFLAALIALGVILWRIIDRLYKRKDDLIALYKARLDGATPDEARTKIQKLEETVRRSVGSPWKPLTYREVQDLAQALRAIEKRRVQVMYENFQGKELARTIADAFETAGWDTHGKIAGEMQTALRGTLLHLKPAEVEAFGLNEGLQQLIDLWNSSQHAGTRYMLDMPNEVGTLPPSTAMHIFRIAEEGLTNAARHAQARSVRLRLEQVSLASPLGGTEPGVRLTIEDDGKGQRRQEQSPMSGMGLVNMRERVMALGGTIALEDVRGGGLRVRIVVPAAVPPAQEIRA
jgi:glucose-6-phosphate-specific signal transduction histidine kinase